MKKKIILTGAITLCSLLGFIIIGYVLLTPSVEMMCLPVVSGSGIDYQESSEIMKKLSRNDIADIINYIRDTVFTGNFPRTNHDPDGDNDRKMVYFGYLSTLPGLDFREAWKSNNGLSNEITVKEYLDAKQNPESLNVPYVIYSVHFHNIQDGSVCVAAEEFYDKDLTDTHQGYRIEMKALRKPLFGKWGFFQGEGYSSNLP